MGFADLSLAEIAADYDLQVEEVFRLCNQLGIAYKAPRTRLALEDAKAIILEIMVQRRGEKANSGKILFPEYRYGEESLS